MSIKAKFREGQFVAAKIRVSEDQTVHIKGMIVNVLLPVVHELLPIVYTIKCNLTGKCYPVREPEICMTKHEHAKMCVQQLKPLILCSLEQEHFHAAAARVTELQEHLKTLCERDDYM